MHVNEDILLNDSANMSGFLNWAFERIQKEIQDIEAMENEYGTAVWYQEQTRRSPVNFTDEEKRTRVAEVDKLRDEGYTFRLACECKDISKDQYAKWRRELKLNAYQKGAQGTRPVQLDGDAGSTPAASTMNDHGV